MTGYIKRHFTSAINSSVKK